MIITEVLRFIAWLAFSFAAINTVTAGVKFFWHGGYDNYWANYFVWGAISFGYYIWHKLK
jgi:hypothetical protein